MSQDRHNVTWNAPTMQLATGAAIWPAFQRSANLEFQPIKNLIKIKLKYILLYLKLKRRVSGFRKGMKLENWFIFG